jgi:two-component system sensor histidine kinase/response regulator
VEQGRPEEALPHLQEAIDQAEGLAAERMAARFREACRQVGTGTWLRTLLKVKRLNESLAEEQALRESLVGTIVHDLGNMTALLDMTIKTALASAPESPEVGEGAPEVDLDALRLASGQCELLVELVSSIVDAQKLEAGGMYTERRATALRPIISRLVEFFRPAADEGVGVVEAADSEDVSALCDEVAVRRVLINLLHNATKYTYPRDELLETLGCKGQISVGVCREGERARVWVQDTGAGVPPEFHDKIFSKFGQVQPGMKKASTGLGLYFCKLAIEAQGGEIGLESEVDVGSTFWFTLPLV